MKTNTVNDHNYIIEHDVVVDDGSDDVATIADVPSKSDSLIASRHCSFKFPEKLYCFAAERRLLKRLIIIIQTNINTK